MTAQGHGGRREGAGRKRLPPEERTVPVAVSMPRWLRDKLRKKAGEDASVSALVVAALRRVYSL